MVRTFGCACLVAVITATLVGQTADPKPSFDSADVRTAPAGGLGVSMSGGVLLAGRYELRSATMVDLVKTAYGVDDDRVLGGPSWLETDRFDIIAKAASAKSDTAPAMLQALLADRFKLVVRTDVKPVPAYVLGPGKGSPKMKTAAGSGSSGCVPQPPPPGPPAPGTFPLNVVSCHDTSMSTLATLLHLMANGYVGDHPVIDQTRIEGSFDFDLGWTPRGALSAAGPDGVSLFDAVEKQLGLKLDLQTVAQPVVVVESVNRVPSANLAGVGSTAPEKPEFEASDIKPSAPGSQGFRFLYQPGGRVNGEGALKDFIGAALGIQPNLAPDLIVGGSKGLDARYTIIAKTPATGIGAATHVNGQEAPPPLSVALVMLNGLLTDRFKLATHKEDRTSSVYVITVPRGGPKMKKAEATERAGCKPDPNAAPVSPAGVQTIAYTCKNTTMAELAQNAAQWANGYFDHPAFDATGLTDGFDFTLAWTPKGALHPAQPAAAGGAPSDPGGLSIFESFDKQLGLKVEEGKRSIPVFVIDHVEEKPTDN